MQVLPFDGKPTYKNFLILLPTFFIESFGFLNFDLPGVLSFAGCSCRWWKVRQHGASCN